MYPELFRIPYFGWPINSFGLMLVIALLSSMWLITRLARRYGYDPELFANATMYAVVSGVIGARISHVIENIGEYTDSRRSFLANLWDAVNIHGGGLTYYGGFLLAFPVLVLYARKKRIPIRRGMDIVAPCLMLALGIGRIGCFLNGCCYGATCDAPWSVQFPHHSIPYIEQYYEGKIEVPIDLTHMTETRKDRPRLLEPKEISRSAALKSLAAGQQSLSLHPAQLYSTITAFLIAAIVLSFLTLNRAAGQGFALMMIVEGIARYVLEMVRAEPPVIGNMSLSMVLGVGITAGGIVLWIVFGRIGQGEISAPSATQA